MAQLPHTRYPRTKRAKGELIADAKEIVRRFTEDPWTGNGGVIDELGSPDYIGRDPTEPEPVRGRAGIKANLEKYKAGFSDARVTVDDQIAEGDRVATRWTGRGTHDGEIIGVAATGKEVTVSGLTISRVENGLVVEEQTEWDALGMLSCSWVPFPLLRPPDAADMWCGEGRSGGPLAVQLEGQSADNANTGSSDSGMSRQFAHSSHMPCPECGASVAAGEIDEHTCEPDRLVEYQLFQLRDEMAAFDEALSAYLDSPDGRFAQWLAERDR